ncbi:MAG: UPF0175 family protein [Candidatus Diapherotrites archaeon]|nr:UPF0175 family protein [Candidatus Diapherotrites archaeon]
MQVVGIRLDGKFLKKIEELGKEENLDRSTAMRLLLEEGYKNHVKKRAAEQYKAGRLALSKAAEKASITLWEMEQTLINYGFKSQCSIEDLKEELEILK